MNSRKKHILFLPKWYPSKFEVHDGNFIENHARAVSQFCSLTVLFVHSDDSLKESYQLIKTEKEGFYEYRIYFKKFKSSIPFIQNLVNGWKYYQHQKIGFKLIEKEIAEVDINHVHINGRNAFFALVQFLKHKTPYLLTEHWSGYTTESGEFKGALRKYFYRLICKKSKAITVVSNYLKNAMERHHLHGNYVIITNTVDTDLFKPVLNKEEQKNKKRIIHISNLSENPKNMPLIIEALEELAKKRDDFEFILIGTGKEEQKTLQALNEGSLKDRFTFLGEISPEKIAEQLQKADFLLLYSKFETQSVVMIEAFSSGIPVLVSIVGGIPEYMNHARGLMIEKNKKNKLLDGISKLLNTSSEYNTQEIRQYAINNFSEQIVGKQFSELYNQLKNGE